MEKQSIHYTLYEYDKALSCLQEAFSIDQQPKHLFYMASLFQHRLEQPELALDHYTRFLEQLPPPPKLSDNPDLDGQIRITMRSAAENSITELKEELFFKGKLKEE